MIQTTLPQHNHVVSRYSNIPKNSLLRTKRLGVCGRWGEGGCSSRSPRKMKRNMWSQQPKLSSLSGKLPVQSWSPDFRSRTKVILHPLRFSPIIWYKIYRTLLQNFFGARMLWCGHSLLPQASTQRTVSLGFLPFYEMEVFRTSWPTPSSYECAQVYLLWIPSRSAYVVFSRGTSFKNDHVKTWQTNNT